MMRKSGALAVCMALMFVYYFSVQGSALAGQTVVVDGDRAAPVYGNGIYSGGGGSSRGTEALTAIRLSSIRES